ncbi:MAG: gliding motility-associated C-terminal domain-containing protein [Prevotellaceae bacterium]|jgi:gliding motility-associated-like protein|nr:gliding motility-associated C-terminal domain-containing protein [Prevotellaceae bacterium]
MRSFYLFPAQLKRSSLLLFMIVFVVFESNSQILVANDDLSAVILGESVVIDVLDNDLYPGCQSEELTISITGLSQTGATVSVVADNKILYTPVSSGADYFKYTIADCNNATDEATVYVAAIHPRSQHYIACPDAIVSMGFEQESGFDFYWYDQQTGGNTVPDGDAVNRLTIKKNDANDVGVWWVEVRSGVNIFPRCKVELQTSNYCGALNSTGCAASGSIIYKEDFRGNNASDPVVSPIDLIGGHSDLIFTANSPGLGNYALIKQIIAGWAWDGADHTFPKNPTRGYYMYIDPNPNQKDATIYEYDITGLCDGISNLSFTLWATDLDRPDPNQAHAKLEMLIINKQTKDTIVTTGEITLQREAQADVWRQYGFDFNLPSGVADITLKLINRENSGQGNDWALDDIEIRLCAPEVKADIDGKISDTIYCNNRNVTLSANYTDDNTFIANPATDKLEGYWLQSTSADATKPELWTEIPGTRESGAMGDISNGFAYTASPPMGLTYYRYVVSNSANVDNPACRASSGVVSVTNLDMVMTVGTGKNICAGENVSLTAGNTLNSPFKWYSDSGLGNMIYVGDTLITGALYQDTVFYVETTAGSCVHRDSIIMTVTKPPSVKAMDDPHICHGEEITLEILQSDGITSWNVGQTTVKPEAVQQYIVTAQRAPCPDARDTVTVNVSPQLYIAPEKLPPFNASETYLQQLNSNAELPEYTVIAGNLPPGLSLDNSGKLSGISEYNSIFIFTVQAEDIYGCTTTLECYLEGSFFIPKAFTPNGDGINDVFMSGRHVIIFDRLGILIFEGENGWDGTYKNKPVKKDIYFYKILHEPVPGDIKIFTGYIGVN